MQKKAYDQVLDYLKERIERKDIVYGGKIPSERELVETLGISRNSVREALRIMEHTGILESHHGKGTYLVNRMGESLSDVFSMLVLMEESNYREVTQLRKILDKQAYVQACTSITEEGKEKIQRIASRMEAGDLEERMRADHELHRTIYEYSQNHLLLLLLDALSKLIHEQGEIVLRQAASIDTGRWICLHQKIAQCLIEGKIEEGLMSVEEHYQWLECEIKMC